MTTPIETLMAGVEWELEPPQEPGDLPHITHSGVLDLFGNKLRCYRLSNGQAVFHADDFKKMFSDVLT